jgi:hypothetical protein
MPLDDGRNWPQVLDAIGKAKPRAAGWRRGAEAGRDVVGAGRSPDVRKATSSSSSAVRLRTWNESREPRADRSVSMLMTL